MVTITKTGAQQQPVRQQRHGIGEQVLGDMADVEAPHGKSPFR